MVEPCKGSGQVASRYAIPVYLARSMPIHEIDEMVTLPFPVLQIPVGQIGYGRRKALSVCSSRYPKLCPVPKGLSAIGAVFVDSNPTSGESHTYGICSITIELIVWRSVTRPSVLALHNNKKSKPN